MAEYAWFDNGQGRQVFRRLPDPVTGRSSLPCPMIVTDTIEPVQSMADGKYYSSRSALRRTYRADGNPQGVEYVEVGNSQNPTQPKSGNVKRDKAKIRETIQRAMADADRKVGHLA